MTDERPDAPPSDGSTRVVNGKTEIFQLGEWMELPPSEQPQPQPTPTTDPGTAQTEAEFTQGSAEELGRTIRLSWLREAADILLNTWLGYEEEISGVARQMHEADNKYFDTIVYRQLKALMLAGWCAPQERTLAVPNGLVLTEKQWRLLEDFEDVTVMLPGGKHVLTIRAAALHPRSHFQPGSSLHDELWASREEAARQASQPAPSSADDYDRKVPVPRSFLTNLVMLTHALREAGDYAAANALDNFLAVIEPELTQSGINHTDPGRHTLPEMNAQARVKHFLHALAYDPQLHDDVRAVLEYVSAGHKHSLTYGGYPDGRARRALGRLDDIERATVTGPPSPLTADAAIRLGQGLIGKTFTMKVPRGTSPTGRLGWPAQPQPQHVPHPATTEEDLRSQLGQRTDDCEKVLGHLLPILAVHPETKDAVAATQPDTLRASYVAKVAATLLASYANELERMRREGTPGVIHEVDRAFYDLAVKERDLEQAKVDRLVREVERLEGALESTQRGLVRMETQRDDLRTAIAMAAGVDPDQISEIDTDYEDLLKEALAQREASRLVQDAIAEDES